MQKELLEELMEKVPLLKEIGEEKEVAWINPHKIPFSDAKENSELTMADIEDAERRLERFAPL